MSWEELHDATLDRIDVTWSEALVILALNRWSDGCVKPCAVRCLGFRRLEVSHEYPWGPSSAINEVRSRRAGDTTVVKFELQSGDLVVVEERDIAIEER